MPSVSSSYAALVRTLAVSSDSLDGLGEEVRQLVGTDILRPMGRIVLSGRATPRKPSQNAPRKRQRRRGLSAAFLVNRGAGGVCNRPSNSGGPLCPPPAMA